MVTKQMAMGFLRGKTLYHTKQRNADGSAKRCRVMGVCKTWKTRPNEFRLPVKYGMFNSFYITEFNANEWLACDVMKKAA